MHCPKVMQSMTNLENHKDYIGQQVKEKGNAGYELNRWKEYYAVPGPVNNFARNWIMLQIYNEVSSG